jgi:replicative DNA helicase
MKQIINTFLFFIAIAQLTGCASLGKGIAEAFLEKQQAVDTRVCEIWGKPFTGLSPFLDNKLGKMKVLMVHGVGDHLPGYATQFLEKLAKELDLPVMSVQVKNIALTSRTDASKNLGNLRISRLLNKDKSKELLFYELTWSVITAKQKEVLAYDNSGEYSFRRAEVNNLMKKFSNDTGPDPIIYLGESREDILVSFGQSFCWMTKSKWDELPDGVSEACSFNDDTAAANINIDQYAFISHSLGSRITIDGMQRIATLLDKRDPDFVAALKNKEIPIYMMSNQLPMLQLGRKLPDVSNQKATYCQSNGEKYHQRMLAKMPIIAFSDPNDLLSYAIPHSFVEKYLDSRLCIDVTNININVATIFDAFGLGKIANPIDAHIGYDTDDRVIALIAKGVGNKNTAKVVNDRCRWVETID